MEIRNVVTLAAALMLVGSVAQAQGNAPAAGQAKASTDSGKKMGKKGAKAAASTGVAATIAPAPGAMAAGAKIEKKGAALERRGEKMGKKGAAMEQKGEKMEKKGAAMEQKGAKMDSAKKGMKKPTN